MSHLLTVSHVYLLLTYIFITNYKKSLKHWEVDALLGIKQPDELLIVPTY